MALVFDSLGYSRRLREAGMEAKVAEAAADAARDYIMLELVTNKELQTAIDGVRRDLDTQTLRLTVRMGVMLAAGLTLLAGVLKLT